MKNRNLRLFFIIFTASGFAGLIYESIWTHYLKLFLGHAAYAQALVLAVFMGGMALGSLICAKYSEHISNLLIGYAVVEVVIGICAVLFHPLYVRFIDFAYASVIPGLGSSSAVAIFKWIAASLLILPQSILLGMTFPLMTAGLLRRFPGAPGSTIAMLYFTNSIGAAIGVLASGFLFIGWVGLPGTLVIAGFINIIVAAVIWLEDKKNQTFQSRAHPAAKSTLPSTILPIVYPIFLVIALLTGLSSFIYEIGWIRMLSLVLGSSTHAFELMLSAFIMGIAFGGLWIKRRIDSLDDPRRFLAAVQIAMGILALATLPIYGSTFNVMAWLIRHLPKTEMGYFIFNLTSQGIAVVVMLPAAFCAGMTLPLITTTLLRSGTGERSIGTVYGFNTIGSILGVLIAIHLAMPLLGLKGMIILGAGIDIALGVGLAWWVFPSRSVSVASTAAGIVALLLPLFWLKLDPNKMASGVYRYGALFDVTKDETIFHSDGKTATVSITKNPTNMSIRTNGKPDAAIRVADNTVANDAEATRTNNRYSATQDEHTMAIAGAIGIIIHPEARTAAVIGWGSGLTTHTLMTAPTIKSVDTIEIEPEMIRAATLFGSRVRLAYDDPRSHSHIEDAKSYFSFHNKKYDLIISEPSNPWVSGVASLFTKEFYFRIRSYLNEDGLFIQWIQLYEIDMPLVASIMNALSQNFFDYVIYGTNSNDILIVASPTRSIGAPNPSFLSMHNLTKDLNLINISGLPDINVRMIGNKEILAPFFSSYAITTNSDYSPVVDLYAVRSRFFLSKSSDLIQELELNRLPILQMLRNQTGDLSVASVTYSSYPESQKMHYSNMLYHYMVDGQWKWNHPDNPLTDDFLQRAIIAREVITRGCAENVLNHEWWKSMLNITAFLVPCLSQEQAAKLLKIVESPSCAKHLTTAQRNFISLLRAVGKRDSVLMAQYSEQLLGQMEENNVGDADLVEYVVSAGLLGNVVSGRMQKAGLLWNKYGRLLPVKNSQSLAIRLLIAQISRAHGESSDVQKYPVRQ